jgi:hypothetical protein
VSDPTTQAVLGAAVAFLAVWRLYRWAFVGEMYFVWLPPVFVAVLLVGAAGFMGGRQPPVLAALAGLVVGGGVFGWRSWQEHLRHRIRLAEFARRLGLTLYVNDQTYAPAAGQLVDDVGSCTNTLRGTWHGMPVSVFDYRYADTSDGEAPGMVVLSCAATTLEEAQPRMIVRGLTAKEVLRRRLGVKTVVLGDVVFDREFRVETADLEVAKSALRRRTREWLLANARGSKVFIDGETLLLLTRHHTMEQIPDLVERIRTLRGTFV